MRLLNLTQATERARQALFENSQNVSNGTGGVSDNFGTSLRNAVVQMNQDQIAADSAVNEMVQTQGANVHETMIALERADISLRLATKIGQKLVQAYQDVSRMQL